MESFNRCFRFCTIYECKLFWGILITEWFDGNPSENSNRDLKITVRFLTNEIRSDALEISIHEKICKDNSLDCSVSKIESKLQNDIKIAILKRAAILEKRNC